MMYGPQAALIAESFTGRLRYSGASLGYQLASVIAGGPAPLIAAALFAQYKSGYAIACYILFCAILSLVADVDAQGLHQQGHLAGVRRDLSSGQAPRLARTSTRRWHRIERGRAKALPLW